MKTFFLVSILSLFMINIFIPLSVIGADRGTEKKASVKEIYELQERCAKKAKAVYEDVYYIPLAPSSQDYESHYNVRLNKCFMLVTNSAVQYLVDINERTASMYFFSRPSQCIIENKPCTDLSAWDAYVNKMMEK